MEAQCATLHGEDERVGAAAMETEEAGECEGRVVGGCHCEMEIRGLGEYCAWWGWRGLERMVL